LGPDKENDWSDAGWLAQFYSKKTIQPVVVRQKCTWQFISVVNKVSGRCLRPVSLGFARVYENPDASNSTRSFFTAPEVFGQVMNNNF
jgi:hypothetical protein